MAAPSGNTGFSSDLQGLHILVTRPLPQARQTAETFQAAGAIVSLFPLLEILPPTNTAAAQQQLATTGQFDTVIFISHNAVHFSCQLGGEDFIRQLQNCRIAAIGKKTAQALSKYQIHVDYLPHSGYTSENLLALPVFQNVTQQQILIIRGEGGRELLAETLRLRGAEVAYANVYRRGCPYSTPPQPLKQHHRQHRIDIISLTSSESLHNLLRIMPDSTAAWLKQIPLVVGSQRMANDARQAGFSADIIVAADPGDQSVQQALSQWNQWRQETIK